MTSPLSHDERVEISRRTMWLLEEWAVAPGDQIRILGLPDGTRSRELRKYRDATPLPDDPNVTARVIHLLEIDEALRTTYPRNRRMGSRWMQTPSRHFRGRRPAERLTDGLEGIVSVRAYLDCTYAWDLSGSANTSCKPGG